LCPKIDFDSLRKGGGKQLKKERINKDEKEEKSRLGFPERFLNSEKSLGEEKWIEEVHKSEKKKKGGN